MVSPTSSTRRVLDLLRRMALAAWPTIATAGIVLAVTGLMLLVVEGLSSVVVVLRGPPADVLLERAHTEYDAELGWINKPSVRIDDLYGPGRYLETNAQRFRAKKSYDAKTPPGHVRAICTGDSFTLGYGVSNDATWCELIARMDPRIETVNMGQGGYGVDQAYLWYRRDGVALQHDALIFAFIAEDFVRMMSRTFLGYPKPVLSVESDVPVIVQRPRRAAFMLQWMRQRAEPLQRLRFVEWWRLGSRESPGEFEMAMTPEQGHALALSILEHVRSLVAAGGGDLMVVLLPTEGDLRTNDPWRDFLETELSRRKIPFVDLVSALKKEPVELAMKLFRGHYSEVGNRWVAEHLEPALVDLPNLGMRLGKIPPSAGVSQPAALRALTPVSLQGSTAEATNMGGDASLAVDGSLATRWHSGATQRGGEAITVNLAAATPLRQVRLELGSMGYDFGRILAVDVAGDDGRYAEVLKVPGEEVITTGRDAQVLTLPSTVTARHVRIRQLGRSDENFWSVCEIKLFRETG